MFAYYRTSSYNTYIQRILQGSISNSDSSDLILVKGNSLEWMSIDHVNDSNLNILTSQLQQSVFGTITDANILHCHFHNNDDDEHNTFNFMDKETEVFEEVKYTKKTRHHSPIKGEDIIVTLSEYGKLIFMSIHHNKLLDIKRFETLAEVHLNSPGLEYTKIDKKLAIDPYGRAIAVASFQDNFDIFILNKNMSRIHFDPIVGRGSECEEGIIWQMEFLYTETTSMDKILLVLVVYNDVERLCRLILYAIDASDTQNVTIEKISRLPLEKNTSLPLLLIPLKFQPEAFILITEQQACLLTADDLGCGNVLYPTSMIPKIFRSIECPLFTAYATHLDPTEEYIYLGSAEGHLYKLEVKVTSELNWIPIKKVNPVGQSMCLLGTMDLIEENTARKMDVLLYSGESADSQVLLIPSKHPPASQNTPIDYTVLQVLVNRAPLTDFQIAENFQDHQDALIACSGQGEHGSLSVITHGIQAEFLHASDPEWKGISALWDLSLSSLEYEELSCLIATSAKDTRLFCIEDRQIKDITSTSGIKSDIETIHVDTIVIQQYKLLLQIYSRGLLIIDVGKHDNSVITKWEPDIGTDYHIELATSWQINDKVYIALCIMYKDMFTLYILNIKSNESSPLSLIVEELTTKPLDVCPSYIGQFKFRSKTLLTLGTFGPSLIIFLIENNYICKVQEIDLSHIPPDKVAAPSSIAFLYSTFDNPLYLLIGLQQGSILCFKVNIATMSDDGKIISIQLNDGYPIIYNIGLREVKLLQSCYEGNSIVYALSEQLWKITAVTTLDKNKDNNIQIDRILIPKFQKDSIDAFTFLKTDLSLQQQNQSASRYPIIVTVVDNKLQLFQLKLKSQINTTKINLGETPIKVIYDKTLNCIIAITTKKKLGERKNYVRLIDPISGQPLTDSQLLWEDAHSSYNAVVLSAAGWSVKNENKVYKYFCVGFSYSKDSLQQYGINKNGANTYTKSIIDDEMGTMILFRLKAKPKNSTSTNTYSIKRVWIHVHLPGGVYAICPHPTGILFSAGKEFYLYNLNPINGKLVNTSHKTLDFPITSLHYREDCICVTSHKSSISFFKYNSETRLIEFVKSDFIPRNIHHSLLLNRHLAVGVNQSGGMVALYDDPNDIRQRLQCVFSFHYSDIIVRPKLALLRSQTDLLYDSTSSIMQHILPWSVATSNSTTKNTVKPIVGCTISGGMIHVYRISEMLYSVLSILQDILINYEPAMPLLGSLKNFQWYRALANEGEKSTIHGDLLIEYFCNRLSILEKMEVVQDKTNKNDISPKLKSALISLFSKNQEIRHHSNVVTTNSTDIDFSPGNVVYLLDNILLEFEKYR